MPRSYRHIQEYEKEIIELKSNGYTARQICADFLTYQEVDITAMYPEWIFLQKIYLWRKR